MCMRYRIPPRRHALEVLAGSGASESEVQMIDFGTSLKSNRMIVPIETYSYLRIGTNAFLVRDYVGERERWMILLSVKVDWTLHGAVFKTVRNFSKFA